MVPEEFQNEGFWNSSFCIPSYITYHITGWTATSSTAEETF